MGERMKVKIVAYKKGIEAASKSSKFKVECPYTLHRRELFDSFWDGVEDYIKGNVDEQFLNL